MYLPINVLSPIAMVHFSVFSSLLDSRIGGKGAFLPSSFASNSSLMTKFLLYSSLLILLSTNRKTINYLLENADKRRDVFNLHVLVHDWLLSLQKQR